MKYSEYAGLKWGELNDNDKKTSFEKCYLQRNNDG